MAVKLRERKPGEWWIYVDHKGKRFAKKIGNDKRTANGIKREVEKRLAAGDLGVGPQPESTAPTVAQYAEHYLATLEHTHKYTTCEDYEVSMRLRILPTLGSKHVDAITRAEIKGLAVSLRQAGHSPRVVRKTVSTLSAMLTEVVDDGFLPANPAIGLGKVFRSPEFRDGGAQVDVLTQAELTHLLNTAWVTEIRRGEKVVYPYREHFAFLLLLARTGVRLGEACAVQWGDVDFHGKFIEIRRAWVKGRITTPKSKRTRRVDMSEQLKAELLERYQARFEKVAAIDPEAEAERQQSTNPADLWVFSEGENPPDPDNFRKRVFEPLITEAELRTFTIHTIRHTYASLLLQAGKELLYVCEQLGHHNPRFTLSIYAHLIPRDRRGEVNVLDDPATIRNPGATTADDADPENEKTPEILESPGFLRAGDRGRTGDLMLGKHTL